MLLFLKGPKQGFVDAQTDRPAAVGRLYDPRCPILQRPDHEADVSAPYYRLIAIDRHTSNRGDQDCEGNHTVFATTRCATSANWRPTIGRRCCSGSKDLHVWYNGASKVKVSVECGNSQPEMDDILKCINHVFLAPNEANEAVLARTNTRLTEQKNNPKKIAPPGNPTGSPAPARWRRGLRSSRIAHAGPKLQRNRSAGYQAKAVLWLIVDTDGLPKKSRWSGLLV